MKTLAVNRRASFDYDLLETYEAGLVLSGQEVKSAKLGHASLKGSFVTFKGSEPFLTNAQISPYPFAGRLTDYEPTRARKILLKKSEIAGLIGKSKARGLTLVPVKLIVRRRLVKLEFALGKGKKLHDKREDISKRDAQRNIRRALREK